MRRTLLMLTVLLTTLAVAALQGPGGSALEEATGPAQQHGDDVVLHAQATAAVASAAARSGSEESTEATPTPDELVSELQALLSHHAALAARLGRATLTDDPSFVDAAEDAVVRNINELDAALTPAVGVDVATQLSSNWERQTQSLFQYASGVRDDDADTMRRAEQQIERDIEEQARLIADLSDGRVGADEVTAALRSYFDHQIELLERYGAADYERAFELQRRAFAETFALGTTTATAAASVPEPSPSDELQTALSMLLGEHVSLAIDVMRSGATGGDDFEAAAAALDGNTRDVTEAMDALFGAKRARDFNQVWSDHIDLFVAYTVAVVEDDEPRKRAVREDFDEVMRRFGTTLAKTTGGLVDADVVTAAMGEHEQQLIEQIERYAMDDYSAAHELSYTAYQHIRGVAEVLATSFADAIAEEMPEGGAQTGGGGTANR